MLAALQAWLAQFTLLDWIDKGLVLLLLALFLYSTRQSRAVVLVRGLILLLGLYLFTSPLVWLHLILDKLILGSSVLLAILYQSELRRMIEQMGSRIRWDRSTSLLGDGSGSVEGQSADDYLDELVQAVRELSQNRTGALIVIEMDPPLDRRLLTDGGVPMQAQLSKELLQTIFQTSTLLHDGAVLICNQRIEAAGVILPVSDRVASRQLGTRHRAAMGITEQTPCLCVVVSEETGSISLAEAGRLERPLTSSKLRELLVQKLRPQPESGSEVALPQFAPLLGWARRFLPDLSPPLPKTSPKE